VHKEIIFSKEARDKLKAGVDKLAAAVTTTLGLKGRNVAIGRGWVDPYVVHDGVTVAKQVVLEDPFENIGAQIVREAASKTNDNVGDGTTTATLLAQKIIGRALNVIESGSNPMMIKRGLEKGLEAITKHLEGQSVPIKTKKEKAQVATISAQSEEIGEIIADAYEQVGENGIVTFTASNGFDMEVEVKSGARTDTGYASPYFMTDPNTQEAIMDDAKVLVLDMKMETVADVSLALNGLMKETKKLLIIGEVEGEALITLLYNKNKLNSIVVKPPFMGSRRKEALQDLAILTGAKLVSEDLGRTFDSITTDDLGQIDKIISGKNESVFIGGKGDKKMIKERAKFIKQEVESSKGMKKEILQHRLAMFSGNVAVIKVGAPTEGEMMEKKLRVEDAVNATKAAMDGGIVAGGGVALLQARESLNDVNLKGDEQVGIQILRDILDTPLRKIVENAGMEGAEILANLKEINQGFNVMTMEYGNMIEMGVTDPVKVPISALKNAVSVATLVITTDCIIAPSDSDSSPSPTPTPPIMNR